MRWPGIEPGSTAWKAAMLATIPPKPDSVIFPAFRLNRITEKLTINVPKHVGASIIWDYRCPHSKALTDEDGIRTHACRAQRISSPSP